MGAITRSAVIIRPLRPYLAWAKRDDTTDIAEQVFEDLRRAPHVYLLPEYGDADSELPWCTTPLRAESLP